MKRCKHSRTCLTGGAIVYEWCYECGAIRRLVEISANRFDAATYWIRPVGKGGENPFPMRLLKPRE